MADTRTSGLRAEIDRAGYYPELVAASIRDGVAGEEVLAYLVHQETTFDSDEVRRHVTVLVLTPTRLVVGHTDDHSHEGGSPASFATTSTEAVALAQVRSVVVSRVVADPVRYRPGSVPQEVTVTITWGAVARIDLEPASCPDPDCEADHGYTGTTTADDLALRVSREAEGAASVTRALEFAAALSAATAHLPR